MSMNLNAKGLVGNEWETVHLWQTPTAMTYLIYSDNDGGWERVLHRYGIWLESTLNGVVKDVEDYREHRAGILEHLNELKQYRKLRFYVM